MNLLRFPSEQLSSLPIECNDRVICQQPRVEGLFPQHCSMGLQHAVTVETNDISAERSRHQAEALAAVEGKIANELSRSCNGFLKLLDGYHVES